MKRKTVSKGSDDHSISTTHQIIGIDGLCEMLNIGKNTAYNLLISGEINAFKVGSVWKIPIEGVNHYIEKKCQAAMPTLLYTVINPNRDLYYERVGVLPILVK